MPVARYLRLPLLLALATLGAASLPPGAAAQSDHLLLSEVVVQPRPGTTAFGVRFVEIVNPTAEAVDLSTIYLTDAAAGPDVYYYNIVTGENAGGGASGDFHARFPDGASIAAGDSIAVAINGSAGYEQAYGRPPDFELYEDGTAPDAVPEMVPVFPGSIGAGLGSGGSNAIELSPSAESLVLYRWDGESDLVADVDYMFWGTLQTVRVCKTGVQIDGPDPGAETSAYLPDTAVSSQEPVATTIHAYGGSFRRLDASEGSEIASGGNGVTGHDEMSEPLGSTWQSAPDQVPPAAPANPFPPAAIIMQTTLSPAQPTAGRATAATVGLVSYDAVQAVTVWYRTDGGDFQAAAATEGAGGWTAELPALDEGVVVDWYAEATTVEGSRSVSPAAAPRYLMTFTVAEAGAPSEAVHLFLTEICVKGSNEEFIEIANPTVADVDLSDYYLTDANYSPDNQHYWRIVEPNPSRTTIGGGDFYDFHARFPDGAVLAAGDTLTVAIAGSDAFAAAYGFLPDYELYEDATTADDVPDMREVFDGSIVGATVPSLTNGSEVVILYYWNGQTDLVTDVDVFMWGSTTSNFFCKTGVSEDGPDPDSTPTSYQPEYAVAQQTPFPYEHDFGESYTRVLSDEGNEVQFGSNGVGGDDEVSEDLPVTFATLPVSPAGPEVPGGGAGKLALLVPARTFLPVAGQTLPVRFTTRTGSHTMLRIFDMEGRLVLTLYDSAFDPPASVLPGEYTLRAWDGRDEEFELVPAGLYIIHLSSVDRKTGDEKTETAPAVVATRLSD